MFLRTLKQFSLCLLLSFAVNANANGDESTQPIKLEEGVDYQVIANANQYKDVPADKILIQEFFSYGCPWCARVDPKMAEWHKKQAKHIQLRKIPVLFKKGWDFYAKAYYTADALGIEESVSPQLFDQIINKRKSLQSTQSMVDFFKSHGVDEQLVRSAFTSSMSLDSKVSEGMKIMNHYKIYMIPSVVVDGKYSTSLAAAKGDPERMVAIVDALVTKAKKEKNIK